MNEDIALYVQEAKETKQHVIEFLENELAKVSAGKASVIMFNGVMVDYYGMPTPINQVANIKIVDARSVTITPFEKKSLSDVEKAIFQANLGVTPQNDGEIIRIVFPPMTEERRRDLVKQCKQKGENAKVSIRNVRKDANNGIKALSKDGVSEDAIKIGEEEVQKLTDVFIAKVDKLIEAKEKEIMTV